MYTWGQIRLLLSPAAATLSPDLLDGFINTRYAEILDHYPWKGLEVNTTLETTAAYTSGTVSVTQGSAAIVGTGTVWTSGMSGLKFNAIADATTYVFTFVDATHGTLDRLYEGGSSATATFAIFQDTYVLPANVKTLLSVVSPITGRPLEDLTERQEIERPLVPFCPGEPQGWAMAEDTNELNPPVLHTVRLTPAPNEARGYPMRYQKATAGFDGTTTAAGMLPWVTDQVLLNGCKADIKAELKYLESAEMYEAKFTAGLAAMVRQDIARRGQAAAKMGATWTRYRQRRLVR
jgi:hypothetical protein